MPLQKAGLWSGTGDRDFMFLVTAQHCHFLLVALGQSSSTTTWPACPKKSKRLPKQSSPSPRGKTQEVLLRDPSPLPRSRAPAPGPGGCALASVL